MGGSFFWLDSPSLLACLLTVFFVHQNRSQIGLKNPGKPFPLNTDVGVLKWRFQTTDESNIPLSSKFNSR